MHCCWWQQQLIEGDGTPPIQATSSPPQPLTQHPHTHTQPHTCIHALPQVSASYDAGHAFGAAKATFEATNRGAIHASLLMLYAWGGWLVAQGLMPVGVLISGIGFTFSLMYSIQGSVSTLSELRRATGAFQRVRGSGAGGCRGWSGQAWLHMPVAGEQGCVRWGV